MLVGTSRPTIVTGLAALAIILGVLSILTGSAGVGLSVLVVRDYSRLAATILLTLGTIVFVFGILEIVYGVGFLEGARWSWTLGIIVAVVSLVSSIAALVLPAAVGSTDVIVLGVIGTISVMAIVPMATSSVTIYFLTRPNVKAFFGRSPATGNHPK